MSSPPVILGHGCMLRSGMTWYDVVDVSWFMVQLCNAFRAPTHKHTNTHTHKDKQKQRQSTFTFICSIISYRHVESFCELNRERDSHSYGEFSCWRLGPSIAKVVYECLWEVAGRDEGARGPQRCQKHPKALCFRKIAHADSRGSLQMS